MTPGWQEDSGCLLVCAERHRLGDAGGYSVPLMSCHGCWSQLPNLLSGAELTTCGFVSHCSPRGQTATLCHGNRHTRDRARREGCRCPCETPHRPDTSSRWSLCPPGFTEGSAAPQHPTRLPQGSFWKETHLTERGTGRHWKSEHGPRASWGLKTSSTPEVPGPPLGSSEAGKAGGRP